MQTPVANHHPVPRPDSPFRLVGEHGYPFVPRGLRREAASYYVGVSPTKFDDWVLRKIMPGPKKQDGIAVWDRRALDQAFDALPNRDEERVWDDVHV